MNYSDKLINSDDSFYYDSEWFREQGKLEGFYSVKLLKTEELGEALDIEYLVGYVEGAKEKIELSKEELLIRNAGRINYIRTIGELVGFQDYPATSKRLNQGDRQIFDEGYQIGKEKKEETLVSSRN